MKLSPMLVASVLIAATSCGPGDALYRAFVKVGQIKVDAPKTENSGVSALIACSNLKREDIQIDIGLMKIGESGMQSVPRHLVIRPDQGGWLYEPTLDVNANTVVRIRGSRPQELQFVPGNYLIAITGVAKCGIGASRQIYPLVYYSSQEKPLAPGSEINIVANAKFSSFPLGCTSPSPQDPGDGFANLEIPTDGYTPVTITLVSPTSPSINTTLSGCTYTELGPVPAMGRYFLRIKDPQSSNETCYEYKGTSPISNQQANWALARDMVPCPAL